MLENATNAMYMAQGASVNSSPLQGFIQQWGDAIKTWGTIIIGIIALIAVASLIIKAMNAFRSHKMNDGIMNCVYIVIVVILAIFGIGGLFALVNSLNPVDGQKGSGVESGFLK